MLCYAGGLVDTVKDGVTGFHMGRFDPDDLLPQDVAAVAAAVSRLSSRHLLHRVPAHRTSQASCNPGSASSRLSFGNSALPLPGLWCPPPTTMHFRVLV